MADVGCGSGKFLRVLKDAGYEPTGIDLADNCLDIDLLSVPFVASAVTDLPEGMVFDAVVCADMLEHIPPEALPAVLAALARLAPGAVLGISQLVDVGKLHCAVYPADQWKALLAQHWGTVTRCKVSTSHPRQNENNWLLWRCES